MDDEGVQMIKNSPQISNLALMEIAKIIGGYFTNSQIDTCLKQLRLSAAGSDTTKWKKILFVFQKYQDRNKNSKDTIRILENLYSPMRFIKDKDQYNVERTKLNKILCMQGFELDKSGTIISVSIIKSLDEVNARYNGLIEKLRERQTHEEVIKYCTAELLVENYFHSIFEAAKGLSDRVREMSGLLEDGAKLYDTVFSNNNPILAYNDLETDSEKNQQNGLKEMLKGITHYVRNVTAHEPKIKWIIEESAAVEILTVISFLHSELDKCRKV